MSQIVEEDKKMGKGETEESEFGEFESAEPKGQENQQSMQIPVRVRMPRGKQRIGVIIQRLGGNRMSVRATDGKTRNCRVPGRYRRSLWLRPKDIVMIEPWPDDDNKADVIFKYNSSSIYQLRKRGILDSIKTDF